MGRKREEIIERKCKEETERKEEGRIENEAKDGKQRKRWKRKGRNE